MNALLNHQCVHSCITSGCLRCSQAAEAKAGKRKRPAGSDEESGSDDDDAFYDRTAKRTTAVRGGKVGEGKAEAAVKVVSAADLCVKVGGSNVHLTV